MYFLNFINWIELVKRLILICKSLVASTVLTHIAPFSFIIESSLIAEGPIKYFIEKFFNFNLLVSLKFT